MRVLVTGGAGYIGCCVVEELLANGYKPVIFDSFYWGREFVKPYEDKVDIIEGDCRSSKDVLYALEGIDAVIHLAGIVGAVACDQNPIAHHTVNVESIRTLISCCTDLDLKPVQDFIYVSSCSVYGNVKGMYEEVTEETPVSPLSSYAYAKLRSEEIIMEKLRQTPHFHPTILRLTTVFGWAPRMRLDLVTNLFVYRAWKEGKISIFGDGSQYRSLIHVRDIATACVKTLSTPRFIRSGKVFHVGEESNNRTMREIAEAVKYFLPNTKIEFRKGAITDRRDYRINCAKLKNAINWKARYSMEDGIQELIDKLVELDLDWESYKFRNDQFEYR